MEDEYPFSWFFIKGKGIRPRLKKPRLELIQKDIPIIKTLDPSFWKNGQFLRWQLMRLNRQYQEDVDALWKVFWPWFDDNAIVPDTDCEGDVSEEDCEYCLDDCFKRVEDHQTLREYEAIHRDFYPDPEYDFSVWDEVRRSNEYVEDIWHTRSGGYFIPIPNSSRFEFDTACIKPWHGPVSKAAYNSKRNVVVITAGKDRIELHPGRLGWIHPSPIPWVIRFPLPIWLYPLPPWQVKTRPQDWATNLLVYELSQAGMKNMGIARLLFGVEKSTTNYPDKEPVLVRINTIIGTVGKTVSQAYPLPYLPQLT